MNRLQEPRCTALTGLAAARGTGLPSGLFVRLLRGLRARLRAVLRAGLTGGLASIIRFTRLAVTCTLGACLLLTLGAAVPAELGPGHGPVLPAVTAAPASAATTAACQEREPPRDGVGHSHLRLRCAFADTRPLKTPDGAAQLYLDHRRARAATDPRGHDGRPRANRIRAVGDTRALLQVLRC
ncbi:hypothetical protein GCM10023085_17990 [Actinomadura viridis]|uniref:Uncharacterized protein n=1 Tax=Actinomadura viridis TaxID=58110 RepID=A0A931DE74_9ACTN|nr:hypothetical protein [Actinomadura viridis]MBG6089444.1 hypothetical protein [Actinomadura viridis]